MSQVFPCLAWYGASHGKEKGMKDELREMPPLLTPQQLADMTGGQVNVSTVRRKCAAGEIPAVKVGKKWFVVRDKLLETA